MIKRIHTIITNVVKKYSPDGDIRNGFCYCCDALSRTFLPSLVGEITIEVADEVEYWKSRCHAVERRLDQLERELINVKLNIKVV